MRHLLNLLSPDKKKALRQGFIMAYVQSMSLFLFAIALAVTGTMFSVRMTLAGTYAQMSQPTEEKDDYQQNAGVIKMINAYASRVDALIKRPNRWPDMLIRMSAVVPDGVVIDDEIFQPDGKTVIRGTAARREDLLDYQAKLGKLPFVSDIVSPLSNIMQKRDVRFELSMKCRLDKVAD